MKTISVSWNNSNQLFRLILKKDIHIPEVTDVAIAAVFEYNDIYKTDDWNVYIINKKSVDLELVVIVSQGFSDKKTTSLFRKKLDPYVILISPWRITPLIDLVFGKISQNADCKVPSLLIVLH